METREPVEANSSPDIEKVPQNVEESENVDKLSGNLVYDDTETEPELHLRTYVALGAMFFLNLVQVFALQGPPVVVRINLHIWRRRLTYADMLYKAILYWSRSERQSCRYMGAKRPLTCSSGYESPHRLCIRYFPGPKDPSCWVYNHLFYRRGYCARLKKYWQNYCRPGPHRSGLCYSSSGLLCSKRDSAKEMET